MNVALTRAQNFLWVVGHANTLSSDKNWGDFIRYCYSRKCTQSYTKKPIMEGINIIQDYMKRVSKEMKSICSSKPSILQRIKKKEHTDVEEIHGKSPTTVSTKKSKKKRYRPNRRRRRRKNSKQYGGMEEGEVRGNKSSEEISSSS